MALDCYLKYTDTQNGIKGETTVNEVAGVDVTDHSEIMQVHHVVESPRETTSGRPTGRRIHKPIRMLKRIDKATPSLLEALVENQTMGKLELLWFRPDPMTGLGQQFYKIDLENAQVVKVETELRDTRDPGTSMFPPLEWVEFSYQKITWTWLDGNVEASDDWQAVRGA
jgi:type VI secretion system secreted protein Hcp